MICLALDLGTKTGYCIYEYNAGADVSIIDSGSRSFAQPSSAAPGRRFCAYRDWLHKIISKYCVCNVYYEHVYGHTGIQASHVYGGFLYMLASVCCDLNVALHGIPVTTIKKVATGTGKACKQDMINVAKAHGCAPVDDNEADAIAIMITATRIIGVHK